MANHFQVQSPLWVRTGHLKQADDITGIAVRKPNERKTYVLDRDSIESVTPVTFDHARVVDDADFETPVNYTWARVRMRSGDVFDVDFSGLRTTAITFR
jgi:hypothetical protein